MHQKKEKKGKAKIKHNHMMTSN